MSVQVQTKRVYRLWTKEENDIIRNVALPFEKLCFLLPQRGRSSILTKMVREGLIERKEYKRDRFRGKQKRQECFFSGDCLYKAEKSSVSNQLKKKNGRFFCRFDGTCIQKNRYELISYGHLAKGS